MIVLSAHVAYYTAIVGGDHFEYRVFSHLVPLILVSFLWFLNQSRLGPRWCVAWFATFLLISLPVPWTHWQLSQQWSRRGVGLRGVVRIAEAWPVPIQWYARWFDDTQDWLTRHYVCLRHHQHKVDLLHLQSIFPSRSEGEQLPARDFPVFPYSAVGYAAWVLPTVNIIDTHGLNDYVVARAEPPTTARRLMAHQRVAPPAYVNCFRPNVRLSAGGSITIAERSVPFGESDIRRCEESWWKALPDTPSRSKRKAR